MQAAVEPVSGLTGWQIAGALAVGAFCAVLADAMIDNKLRKWRNLKSEFEPGFLAVPFIGAAAVLIMFALNPPGSGWLAVLASAVISGLGADAVLRGYVEAPQQLKGAANDVANAEKDVAKAEEKVAIAEEKATIAEEKATNAEEKATNAEEKANNAVKEKHRVLVAAADALLPPGERPKASGAGGGANLLPKHLEPSDANVRIRIRALETLAGITVEEAARSSRA